MPAQRPSSSRTTWCWSCGSEFQLEAFTFRQTYDFSKPTEGLGYSRYGGPRRMRYLNNHKFDEIAVLVGNFGSIEDPQMDKTLDTLKHAQPESLDPTKQGTRRSGWPACERSTTWSATNPTEQAARGRWARRLSPAIRCCRKSMFVAKGLDPFVVDMNKDLPHSLLKCPGQYTVRVASFRGVDTMKPAEFEQPDDAAAKDLEDRRGGPEGLAAVHGAARQGRRGV